MPYEITLDTDLDRGFDRYTIALGEQFDSASAHELSDWLAVAAQNPTATFTIDVSHAEPNSPRAVATVLARSAWLRRRRRVDVVRGRRAAPGAAAV